MSSDLNALCRKLGYTFKNFSLLEAALTHRSVSQHNNERLEFLGDSILNFVIAAELFQRYPDYAEGDLSRLRAALVNKDYLAKLANLLGLGEFLILGVGELKSGGHQRNSILADAFEAILGAVYLDAGYSVCAETTGRLFAESMQSLADIDELKDPKTRLQELLQAQHQVLPEYILAEAAGKPHNQVFKVICRIDNVGLASEGYGKSRRKAEQKAAEQMLARLASVDNQDKPVKQ